MKKRTVVTTEKREFWIIWEGAAAAPMPDLPFADVPADDSPLFITDNGPLPAVNKPEQEQDDEK